MDEQLEIKTFNYSGKEVLLYIPAASYVQETYSRNKKENPHLPFPFWAKLWPAGIALADFLTQHKEYVKNKKVMELAAGLGLPSLVAAAYAATVYTTDYLQEAVDIIERSRELNGITNMATGLLDWHHLPENLEADVLLMSDVNYDPAEFDQLYKVFIDFLEKGTTIILSTPQRLMAKPFIEKLLKYVCLQDQVSILDTPVSLFILKAK